MGGLQSLNLAPERSSRPLHWSRATLVAGFMVLGVPQGCTYLLRFELDHRWDHLIGFFVWNLGWLRLWLLLSLAKGLLLSVDVGEYRRSRRGLCSDACLRARGSGAERRRPSCASTAGYACDRWRDPLPATWSTENGYARKYVKVSEADDWYVKCE
jgi:hypothetical protein